MSAIGGTIRDPDPEVLAGESLLPLSMRNFALAFMWYTTDHAVNEQKECKRLEDTPSTDREHTLVNTLRISGGYSGGEGGRGVRGERGEAMGKPERESVSDLRGVAKLTAYWNTGLARGVATCVGFVNCKRTEASSASTSISSSGGGTDSARRISTAPLLGERRGEGGMDVKSTAWISFPPPGGTDRARGGKIEDDALLGDDVGFIDATRL